MSDAVEAPVAQAASPKKKAATSKKAAGAGSKKSKAPTTHPKYSEMIAKAIAELKERGGSSRQAILKYIVKHYSVGHDEQVVNQHLKKALKTGIKNKTLKQSKGTGASGSFRIGEKTSMTADKKKKASKPAAAAKKPSKSKTAKSPKKKIAKASSGAAAKKPKAASAKKPKTAKPVAAKKPKADKPKKPKTTAAKPKAAAKPKSAAKVKKPAAAKKAKKA